MFDTCHPHRSLNATVRIINDLFALLHARQVEISSSPVTPARLAELLTLIDQHVITAKIAREVLSAMMSGDSRSARAIIDTSGQQQIDDHAHLLQLCRDVLRDSPNEVLSAGTVGPCSDH